jgi:hypothetical protein
MRPRERRETGGQDLFRSRLDQIIDMSHALVKLARAIDWRVLEERFGSVYTDGPGSPLLLRWLRLFLRVILAAQMAPLRIQVTRKSEHSPTTNSAGGSLRFPLALYPSDCPKLQKQDLRRLPW